MIAHFILEADVLASAFFIILLLIIQAYFLITIDFMYDQKVFAHKKGTGYCNPMLFYGF